MKPMFGEGGIPCPMLLSPKQKIEESVLRAQVLIPPGETAEKPVFGVGGVACPKLLPPKQTMEESILRAQVVLALLPEETAI